MGKCPIWGTPAKLAEPITGDAWVIESDRVGGRYRISGTARELLKSASVAHKKLLTTWIYQQHRAGIEVADVTSNVLDEVKTRRPMRYSQRISAILLFYDSLGGSFGRRTALPKTHELTPANLVNLRSKFGAGDISQFSSPYEPGPVVDVLRAELKFAKESPKYGFSKHNFESYGKEIEGLLQQYCDANRALNSLLAATELASAEELSELLTLMEAEGYVTNDTTRGILDFAEFSPTPRGWAKIEELSDREPTGSQAFVAMWFDPSTEDAYSNGLFKAIYDCGYDPLRIDKKEHNNKIDDEIVAEIRRSRFLVADFTCGCFEARGTMHFVVRGGVYFEAGFAMALPIPVIWTCRDTAIGGLHFDTRQYAHIVWKDATDLYGQLKARIGATIGLGPLLR
jgi:hypothetical protein